MDIVDPRPHPSLVPANSRAIVVAERQEQYRALPSVRTPRGQIITRWTPTDDERAALLRGEDVYVTLWCPGLVTPLWVTVGPMDWAAVEREQLGGA